MGTWGEVAVVEAEEEVVGSDRDYSCFVSVQFSALVVEIHQGNSSVKLREDNFSRISLSFFLDSSPDVALEPYTRFKR